MKPNCVKTMILLALIISGMACATSYHPCTDGGDPAWEPPLKSPGGTKECTQHEDKTGKWVNDGRYVEYFLSGKHAIDGEYRMGKKDGIWRRFDEAGKTVAEEYYDHGVKVPNRTTSAKELEELETKKYKR